MQNSSSLLRRSLGVLLLTVGLCSITGCHDDYRHRSVQHGYNDHRRDSHDSRDYRDDRSYDRGSGYRRSTVYVEPTVTVRRDRSYY